MSNLPPRVSNVNNGFIQPILSVAVTTSAANRNTYTNDWKFRARSNHRDPNDYFDFLTLQGATFYLWLIDEIEESVRRRTTSHSE